MKIDPDLQSVISEIGKEAKSEKSSGRFIWVLLKPLGVFLRSFFVRGGIVRGTKGFVFSVLTSLKSFIADGDSFIRARK